MSWRWFTRPFLNIYRGTTNDPVEREEDHFFVCPECGQTVDYRKLGDVFYHDEPGHKPLHSVGDCLLKLLFIRNSYSK